MATIEISDEALDEIIKDEMIQAIYFLRRDMQKVKETNHGYVFSKDPKVDLLKIDALIDAYLLILEHYGYKE
jgi:hypothetical protein